MNIQMNELHDINICDNFLFIYVIVMVFWWGDLFRKTKRSLLHVTCLIALKSNYQEEFVDSSIKCFSRPFEFFGSFSKVIFFVIFFIWWVKHHRIGLLSFAQVAKLSILVLHLLHWLMCFTFTLLMFLCSTVVTFSKPWIFFGFVQNLS